jgi:alpha-1,2-mannosyltransferase
MSATTKWALAALGTLCTIVIVEWFLKTPKNHFGITGVPYHYNYADLYGRLANIRDLKMTGNIYRNFLIESFSYPPGAIFLFWPLQFLPLWLVLKGWMWLSVLCLAGSCAICYWQLSRRSFLESWGIGCLVASASFAIYPPDIELLAWGQTASILLILVVADSLIVPQRYRGVLVGLATAIKIYPGVFIVMWLWRREWRQAIIALATSVSVTCLATILWFRSSTYFFKEIVAGGAEWNHLVKNFAARYASSSIDSFLQRSPFSANLFNGIELNVASLAVIALGLFAAQRLWKRKAPISSLICLIAATNLGSPVAWDHYFAFAPMLIFAVWEVNFKSWFGKAAAFAAVIYAYPWVHHHQSGHAVAGFLSRNAIFLATMLLLVAAFFDRAHRPIDYQEVGTTPHINQ